MDYMKYLDCNQIKIFINLEIIGEEKLYIYIKSFFFKLQFSEGTWQLWRLSQTFII